VARFPALASISIGGFWGGFSQISTKTNQRYLFEGFICLQLLCSTNINEWLPFNLQNFKNGPFLLHQNIDKLIPGGIRHCV